MDFIAAHPLLLLLPLLPLLAGLFSFAGASVAASRQYALGASVTISLLVGLLTFLQYFGGPSYLEGMLFYSSLGIFLAQIVAAPLLDRSRLPGLVVGSVAASFALLACVIDALPTLLPLVPLELWLLCTVLGAALVGLTGSAMLPTHPARAVRGGQLRAPMFGYGRMAGVLLAAASFVLLAASTPQAALSPAFAVSAITAALYPLLFSRGAMRLQLAAEGVLAGSVVAILSTGSGVEGLAYGIIAAVLVQRGDRIAGALRLDDPARIVGTVLLPALLGTLLPFASSLPQLADALRWLGATVLVSGVISLVWLGVKATVGFAAAPSRVREGLDFLS